MRARGAISATTLRGRPAEQKAAVCRTVVDSLWPLVADGKVKPVVHTTFPMNEVAEAHRLVDESSHIGKVLLTAI
jgi:NADPH:quinone reductase-like Zn-dependent oxidoreductase